MSKHIEICLCSHEKHVVLPLPPSLCGCIEVTPSSKIATISEELCIGCGICVRKCPFEAIHIINLPSNLESKTTHRYSANSFKLHRLPTPRPGNVLGLVGTNGIGKTTALKVAVRGSPHLCNLLGTSAGNPAGNLCRRPCWELAGNPCP